MCLDVWPSHQLNAVWDALEHFIKDFPDRFGFTREVDDQGFAADTWAKVKVYCVGQHTVRAESSQVYSSRIVCNKTCGSAVHVESLHTVGEQGNNVAVFAVSCITWL